MRNKKMLLTGLVAAMMGMAIVGCGSDGKSASETEQAAKTEAQTETEVQTEAEAEIDETEDDADDYSYDDDFDDEDFDGEGSDVEDSNAGNTDEDSTEFTMPVYEDFTLAPGLSENYVDLDNRAFVYNGKKYTLGESTLKDLIDGGIPFEKNSLNNSGNNVNKNYETERYTADINDYVTMQFMFGNFTDSEQKAEDCVLSYVRYSHLFVPHPEYDASMNAEISEMMLDGAKQVNFSFPTTITKDQLLEKCSENAEEDGKVVRYNVDSEVYMGDSGYNFEFDETTGQLKEVRISWLP